MSFTSKNARSGFRFPTSITAAAGPSYSNQLAHEIRRRSLVCPGPVVLKRRKLTAGIVIRKYSRARSSGTLADPVRMQWLKRLLFVTGMADAGTWPSSALDHADTSIGCRFKWRTAWNRYSEPVMLDSKVWTGFDHDKVGRLCAAK